MSKFNELLAQWRHHIHQHPETAFEEFRTASFVAEKLSEMGIEVTTGIGGTGVVGTLTVGNGKKVVGLRADMDAIVLQEEGSVSYKSECDGKMHGCGHDGHTITLLGAAKLLSESRDFNGTVRFVFQPAEEPGKGAHAMMNDGLLERFPKALYIIGHLKTTDAFSPIRSCTGGFELYHKHQLSQKYPNFPPIFPLAEAVFIKI